MSKIASFSWIWVVHCLILPKNHILLTQFLSALFNAEVCLLVRASIGRYPPFFPDFIQHSVSCTQVFFGVSQRIAGERKELFAKIQKELFQQTIAVRGRPGFYGSTGLPSWPKNVFSRPGLCAASQFSAYPVRFWALNFGQFGQNSPHTLIRTHWWRSWSPLDDSRLRFGVVGKKPSHVPILRCEYSVARATLVLYKLLMDFRICGKALECW